MEKGFLKKELGKFLGAFFVLYLIVFVVLNITGWLIRPRPLEISSGSIESNPKEESQKETPEPERPQCVFSQKSNSVLISKIGIEAPLVFPENEDKEKIEQALNTGVVYHPSSSAPGESGQTILLGHSASLGWPKIRYDWVFSDLKKLEEGDEAILFFNNCQYTYKVVKKYFLDRGEQLPDSLTNSESVLILISCWPPGRDIQRIAVEAVLMENN